MTLSDHTTQTAMIAVQGPLAIDLVCELCSADDASRIRGLRGYRATQAAVAGVAAAVSRTGYTGEDGVELVVSAAEAAAVWEAILAAGADRGVRACGLGARDTLRLEAGMPLYGHELQAGSDPFALGLGLAVNLDTAAGEPRAFPGAAALRAMKSHGPARVRVGLAFDSKRSAREGSVVVPVGGTAAAAMGVVTSGSFAPTLGHAVAMALVDPAAAAVGSVVDVLIRDAAQPARVVTLPFYRRGGSSG